jgi:hypothetical protein
MILRPIAAAAAAVTLVACVPASPTAPEDGPAQDSHFARFGEEVRPGGVVVRPLRLVEDSRCPQGVQCVQAGTVRIAVRIGAGGSAREAVLRLRDAEALGGGRVLWLVGACPLAPPPGRPIAAGDYRFQLAVGREGASAPPPPICASY